MRTYNKYLVLVFMLLIGFQYTSAQSWYYFSGYVFDENNLSPVANYPVYIDIADSIQRVVFTDDSGYYLDSVFADPASFDIAVVFVGDCFGEIEYEFFQPPELQNFADFEICVIPDDCDAFFYYENDFENPMLVNFFDLSNGNINKWVWDFGDFNVSSEVNPSHEYEEAGIYQVVLIVEDTAGVCWSAYSELVFVGELDDCDASFEVELDTLNPIPHTFIFTDISSGNISSWLWDFGDGNFSQEQNPTHTYADGGNYEVCLLIFSNPGGGVQCSDDECVVISTMQYYNFGGHAFIDGFPINVEENDSSNMATAYLYRRLDNQWKFMDTREFWRFGYYWFVEKPEGEYLIRIDLDESAVDYNFYAPSYYENSTAWQYAATINLTSDNQFAVDVNFESLAEKLSGIGVISGYLENGIDCENEISITNQIVKLYDNENQYIAFDYTNDDGEFEFASLGYGTYRLQGEVTGSSSTFGIVELNTNNPFSDENVLVIDCNSFVGVDETVFSSDNLLVKEVFPIPASDFVKLRIQSVSNEKIEIDIIDQTARVFNNHTFNIIAGEMLIALDLRDLPEGLYIFRLRSSDGQILQTGKIIIN